MTRAEDPTSRGWLHRMYQMTYRTTTWDRQGWLVVWRLRRHARYSHHCIRAGRARQKV